MEIRRKILNNMYCNPELRKAIAFSLFIKTRVKSSAVQRWSINKLHEITGVSACAVRKRIDTLRLWAWLSSRARIIVASSSSL